VGFKLRRWLADCLPTALSSGERLVALEIADQANDETRKAYGTDLLTTVARRCGLSDANQVGKILTKLSANGVELRLPIRGQDGRIITDKRGRTMFACKGHQSTFRIPLMSECPALKLTSPGELQSSPAGVTYDPDSAEPQVQSSPTEDDSACEAHPNEAQSSPAGTQSSPAEASKLTQAGDPSPQSPQDSSSLSSAAPPVTAVSQEKSEREDLDEDEPQEPASEVDPFTARLMAEHAATADEVSAVLAAAGRDGIKSLPAWAKSATGKDDFAQRLRELRARAAAAAGRAARRSTCTHSDVLDPDPPPGWGNCLLCNTARRRASPPRPPVAAEPEANGPPDLAELMAGLERAAAASRAKTRKTPVVVREPLTIDAKTIAAREAVAAAEGFRPLVEPEEGRASA
jgi:hypothetical protein